MIVPNTPYWIRGCRMDGRCVIQDDQNPEFYGVYERQADGTFWNLADSQHSVARLTTLNLMK